MTKLLIETASFIHDRPNQQSASNPFPPLFTTSRQILNSVAPWITMAENPASKIISSTESHPVTISHLYFLVLAENADTFKFTRVLTLQLRPVSHLVKAKNWGELLTVNETNYFSKNDKEPERLFKEASLKALKKLGPVLRSACPQLRELHLVGIHSGDMERFVTEPLFLIPPSSSTSSERSRKKQKNSSLLNNDVCSSWNSDTVFTSPPAFCRTLEKFIIPNRFNENFQPMLEVLQQHFTRLEYFYFDCPDNNALAACETVGKMKQLKSLSISSSRTELQDNAFEKLGNLTNLTSLNISRNGALTENCARTLAKFTKLESLTTVGCPHIVGQNCEGLIGLDLLKRLTLRVLRSSNTTFKLSTKRFENIITSCPLLESLNLSRLGFTPGGVNMEGLRELKFLRSLNFEDTEELSDENIKSIARCNQLTQLNLNGTSGYSSKVFANEISQLENLDSSFMITNGKSIDDETFRFFLESKSPAIRRNTSLRFFDADRITDGGIAKYLVQMKHLETVAFEEGALLTDEGVKLVLEQLPRLKWASFRHCSAKITEKSIDFFLERVKKDEEAIQKGQLKEEDALSYFCLTNYRKPFSNESRKEGESKLNEITKRNICLSVR